MEKYLQAILSEVKTIIIPNLGALTITNADTGEFMFMSFLKHDDGQLSGFIAKTDGIDEPAAKEKIASMVSEIQARLASGASYAMPNFGRFVMNDGDIDFAPWSEDDSSSSEPIASSEENPESEPAYIPEASPEPPLAEEPELIEESPEVPPIEDQVSEGPIAEPPVVEDTQPIEQSPASSIVEDNGVKEIIPEPNFVEEPIAEEPIPAPRTLEAPPIIESPANLPSPAENEPDHGVAPNPISTEGSAQADPSEVGSPTTAGDAEKQLNVLQKERLAASQEKLDKLRKAKEQKPPRKKRSVAFWMLMTLLALIVTGGVLVGVFFEDVKQHIPFLADTEEPVDKEETDLLDDLDPTMEEDTDSEEEVGEEPAEEPEEQVETTEEPAATPPLTSPSSNLPWHWIAGSFSVETNANRLATKLRDQGLSSTVIQAGGMYLVSAKAFESKEAALAGRAEVSSAAPGSWLYESR